MEYRWVQFVDGKRIVRNFFLENQSQKQPFKPMRTHNSLATGALVEIHTQLVYEKSIGKEKNRSIYEVFVISLSSLPLGPFN